MNEGSNSKKKINPLDVAKIFSRSMSENESSNLSLDKVCEYLEIDEKSQQRISKLAFHKIDASIDGNRLYEDIIKLEDLVGVNLRELTHNAWSWLEQLEELRFSKIKMQSESYQQMFDYLNEGALKQEEDLPIVIKHNNKYFIDEGLHRLTISKCIGIEKFKVLICKPKSTEIENLNKNS